MSDEELRVHLTPLERGKDKLKKINRDKFGRESLGAGENLFDQPVFTKAFDAILSTEFEIFGTPRSVEDFLKLSITYKKNVPYLGIRGHQAEQAPQEILRWIALSLAKSNILTPEISARTSDPLALHAKEIKELVKTIKTHAGPILPPLPNIIDQLTITQLLDSRKIKVNASSQIFPHFVAILDEEIPFWVSYVQSTLNKHGSLISTLGNLRQPQTHAIHVQPYDQYVNKIIAESYDGLSEYLQFIGNRHPTLRNFIRYKDSE